MVQSGFGAAVDSTLPVKAIFKLEDFLTKQRDIVSRIAIVTWSTKSGAEDAGWQGLGALSLLLSTGGTCLGCLTNAGVVAGRRHLDGYEGSNRSQ